MGGELRARCWPELADALWRAELERAPIDPLTDAHPSLGIADGVRDPERTTSSAGSRPGATVRGRKVGLTSRRTQQLLGVDEPDFGVLLDDMFVDDGAEIVARPSWSRRGWRPRSRSCMARRPGRPRGHHGRRARPRSAACCPAIEVVDSRIADWRSPARRHRRRQRVVPPGWCSGGRITPSRASTCGCWGCCSPATARRSTAARARPRSATRPAAWPGWPTSSAGSASGLRRGDVVLPGALHRMVPGPPRRPLLSRVRPPRHRHACGSARRDVAA